MGRRRVKNKGREKQVSTSEITTSDVPVPPLNPPEELVIEVLSWLPVESLLRFWSVCKPWLSLISSPNFAKTQLKVITLKTPTTTTTRAELLLLDVVDCGDGIVCLKSLGVTFLWNPATKQAKGVPFSRPSKSCCCCSSVGFGFDPLSSDYKVVRILYGFNSVRYVQVYSLNAAGSWGESKWTR